MAGCLLIQPLIGQDADIVFLPQRREEQNKQARNIHCITDIEATNFKQKVVNTKGYTEAIFLSLNEIQKFILPSNRIEFEQFEYLFGYLRERAMLGWWILKAKLEFIQMNVESSLCNLCK